MKYNYICIIGSIPFGFIGLLIKSKTMVFSSVMGILFHTHPNNISLKYLDLGQNIILGSIATTYDSRILIILTITAICYILNCFVYKPKHSENIGYNVRHICICNVGGLYGYYILYNIKPCIELYFTCE
tara:strand:- start:1090 stop:1476 length:387 start_codon:yes stop_codon:yes gene_type:complete